MSFLSRLFPSRALSELEKELEIFRREEVAAQQYFFAYLALHEVPSEEKPR